MNVGFKLIYLIKVDMIVKINFKHFIFKLNHGSHTTCRGHMCVFGYLLPALTKKTSIILYLASKNMFSVPVNHSFIRSGHTS